MQITARGLGSAHEQAPGCAVGEAAQKTPAPMGGCSEPHAPAWWSAAGDLPLGIGEAEVTPCGQLSSVCAHCHSFPLRRVVRTHLGKSSWKQLHRASEGGGQREKGGASVHAGLRGYERGGGTPICSEIGFQDVFLKNFYYEFY